MGNVWAEVVSFGLQEVLYAYPVRNRFLHQRGDKLRYSSSRLVLYEPRLRQFYFLFWAEVVCVQQNYSSMHAGPRNAVTHGNTRASCQPCAGCVQRFLYRFL